MPRPGRRDVATVGLFGGSFNPPHIAHLILAEWIREAFALDQILWMPSASPPHKPARDMAPLLHRLAMTRLATADQPAFAVSDLEHRRPGPSYTVDTVRILQETYPDRQFRLIIGSDNLLLFHTWYRPDEIAAQVPLIVYPRPGALPDEADLPAGATVQVADAPLLEVSAEAIRQRIREGRTVRYLLPDAVWAYVEQHGLYRD